MTRRRLLLALISRATSLGPFGLASAADAQQPDRMPVVGYLAGATGSDDPVLEAFRQGLRELGYVEGRNVRIEFRTARGHADRLQSLAEELVGLKADVIVSGSPRGTQALQRATSTIPIVMAFGDPVTSGLVTNFAHPGGNITGLSTMPIELSAKRLQLLKEIVPRLSRVTVLWNPDIPVQAAGVEELNAAAASLAVELRFVGAQTPEQIGAAVSAIGRGNPQALYVLESALFFAQRTTLIKLASKARLPAIYATKSYAEAGGLMSYGVSYAGQLRRSAGYVDKILKGAKPGDLPIEQPTKFELVVNLKTAKAMGITFPQSFLVRADKVIE